MSAMRDAIIRNAIGLGIFAVVTAGLIALTQTLTSDRIEAQQREARASALREIIPTHAHDNDMLADTFLLPAEPGLGHQTPREGWRARRDGEVIGIIMPVVAPEGYSGDIHLLVGIDRQGELLGVRVTSHRETPGLGDKIELRKDDWILDFEGRSLDNPEPEGWQVVKDGGEFDQFSGATITPRAVVRAVRRALTVFSEHRDALLDETDNGLPQDHSEWDRHHG